MKGRGRRAESARVAIAALGAVGLVVASIAPVHAAGDADAGENPDEASVKRGEYIVSTAGCHDCHTPWTMGEEGPAPDMSRALSGHPQDLEMPPVPALPEAPWGGMLAAVTNTAFAGPWGVSFARNLTPDEENGIGEWTVDDFVATIRTGRRTGRGREILPPMPIPVYNNLTDEDLAAVYSYLRTIEPIANAVPEPWDPPSVDPEAAASE